MKRTPFKRKPYQWNKNPKKKGLFPEKESKVEEWARVKRDILDPYFHEKGLYYTCELSLKGCIGRLLPLQYAHSKKRDDIASEEPERTRELCEVIRTCTVCHDYIERLPSKDEKTGKQRMYEIVVKIIEKRNERLARWKKVGT